MKKLIVCSVVIASVFTIACGGGEHQALPPVKSGSTSSDSPASASLPPDEKRGIGKFTHVDVAPKLDQTMAASGESIAKTKCLSCHKLTGEKLVGPGWQGVTERRKPEWIMNFVTNTEEMLNKDPEAMAALEICLVRMPNQNLKDEEARQVLEYMRKNDGVK
jgi:mono/diheme cytochrome c family protein